MSKSITSTINVFLADSQRFFVREEVNYTKRNGHTTKSVKITVDLDNNLLSMFTHIDLTFGKNDYANKNKRMTENKWINLSETDVKINGTIKSIAQDISDRMEKSISAYIPDITARTFEKFYPEKYIEYGSQVPTCGFNVGFNEYEILVVKNGRNYTYHSIQRKLIKTISK